MLLEYTKTQSIFIENGCEHTVGGVARFDDLIKTEYVPTNFSAPEKNFFLRDNHTDWDRLHKEAEQKIHREWLTELGYNTSIYYVDYVTHEIKNSEQDTINNILKTNSMNIDKTTAEEI